MAYYHSRGAGKLLREKMNRTKQIFDLINNLRIQSRSASDEERRELDQRVETLRKEVK